jgi:hypothetical protein
MVVNNRTKPDVLRVTEFVLRNSETKEKFSVCEAGKSIELNGIGDHRIAEIMKEICLQPNGPDSMECLTTVDNSYAHNNPGNWQLNTATYFNYLSYISAQNSEKSNKLAIYSIWIASLALLGNILALLKDQLCQLIN